MAAIKKKWYEILAPEELNNIILGETLVGVEKNAIGRTLILNLGKLIRDIKKQNFNVKFKIKDIKNQKALTELISFELTPSQVKRLSKKAKGKADDSFVCVTKDKIKVRIKPMILTKFKVHNKMLSELMKRAKEFLSEKVSKLSYSQFIKSLISLDLRNKLINELTKVYPNIICEIRKTEKIS